MVFARRILGRAGLAAVLGLSAAMGPALAAGPNEPGLDIVSVVKGIEARAIDSLPAAPKRAKAEENCEGRMLKPASAAARAVAARGWGVTGQAPLGPYLAVSFASGFEPGTSGSCAFKQGNVGIFEGTQLVALVYAARGAADLSIGTVAALEGGGVRIWGGDFLPQPIGDLRLDGGTSLRVGPLAAFESRCNGSARVPDIYGLPIDRARAALMKSGWRPIAAKPEPEELGREDALRKKGIVEVDGCSGTGFGFCSFGYQGDAGSLAVTTVGDNDLPSVSDYSVTCR